MTQLTQGSGRWMVGNEPFRSENEPWDHYGMEWSWGLGRLSVKGRLYAIKDGKEVGTLWEYRLFWHPGDRKATVEQFGADGSFGSGYLTPAENGATSLDQTVHSPDGTSFRVGHHARFDGGVRLIQSLRWIGGKWEKQRDYAWRRAP
jgi:hypothetical protein